MAICPSPASGLLGRRGECEALDGLLECVRAGQSRVLVLHGEAGTGKSALLAYVAERASGCHVARASGVEAEMELAFAGLHQLCAPMLDRLARLPGPQRDALSTAFGLSVGPAPDRFLVGLAVLGLLSEVAEERPLVCLIDDVQWQDQASAQTLAFVARRLLAEPVGLIFAMREQSDELAGHPGLMVEGLRNGDARALLGSAIRGRLDERVADRIVAETRGNPLALLEVPRGLSSAELAGGFGLPDVRPAATRIEQSFLRRLDALPVGSRRLLLIAAAEPVGDVTLLWRAADRLGLGPETAAAAENAGLITLGSRVRFRHPLVRSAAYRAAGVRELHEVHRALAEATDPDADPDRRAWHRAHAATGPAEDVAVELLRSAGRAQGRGGIQATAAFLERATQLTPDPGRRGTRALAAAHAMLRAGRFEAALGLLQTAETGPLDDLHRARIDLLRGQIAFVSSSAGDAPSLLLAAARRLEALDIELARETYLDALHATMFAGRLGGGARLAEVAKAARGAPPPSRPRQADTLLDGLAVLITQGYPAGVPMLQAAVSAFRDDELTTEKGLRWLPLACRMAHDVWDDEGWYVLSARLIRLARETGALDVLPTALSSHLAVLRLAGEFGAAVSLADESDAINRATGTRGGLYGKMVLAAHRGQEAETSRLIEATTPEMVRRGEGQWLTASEWAKAMLYNGLGRFEDALEAAGQATQHRHEMGVSTWALVELVEAAAGSRDQARAAAAARQLGEVTRPSGTEWALGIQARSDALVGDGERADALYREAIERLGRTRMRFDLARARLVYGEWLGREGRRLDAREQLRVAYGTFGRVGADAFAERARRELLALGEAVRKPTMETRESLTAQEAQIASMARDGETNPEIGAQLYISPRTVEYHLHKVFTKLGISSRKELRNAIPDVAPVS